MPEKGWVSAIDLRAGDILVTVNGEYVILEKVQHEILESPVTVYNFEVEGFHTYYVGDTEVLVHNSCNHGKEWAAERRSHWRTEGNKYAADPSRMETMSDNGLYKINNNNLNRMLQGKAPRGTDNLPIALHHNQGIAVDFYDYREMLTSYHWKNYRNLHPWV